MPDLDGRRDVWTTTSQRSVTTTAPWDSGATGAGAPSVAPAAWAHRAAGVGVRPPRHPGSDRECRGGDRAGHYPARRPSRTAVDFAAHVAQTIAPAPTAEWIVIMDQLTSTSRRRWCGWSRPRGGSPSTWASRASRKGFLEDPGHRIRILSTPKQNSWLNQIEIWFGILARRVLRRGSFTSTTELRNRLLAFIAYFNATLAKPFKWTFKGRPLTV